MKRVDMEKGKTMSDYIKREDAVRRVAVLMMAEAESDGCEDQPMDNYIECASEDLADIPSADVAPVVRCKDCKCWTEWANGTGSCSRFALDWIGTDADDFCSMGERKDDE